MSDGADTADCQRRPSPSLETDRMCPPHLTGQCPVSETEKGGHAGLEFIVTMCDIVTLSSISLT